MQSSASLGWKTAPLLLSADIVSPAGQTELPDAPRPMRVAQSIFAAPIMIGPLE
jgi:hypothetical protein